MAQDSEFSPQNSVSTENSHDERRGQKYTLGLTGSLVLFIGVFTPIVSLPIVGSVNYFQNGHGDGSILLILAIISLVLTVTHQYKGLWLTGVLSLSMLVYAFLSLQLRLSEMKSQMETDLSGNPFKGIADAAIESIQIQWGWAVMVLGAGLLIAAAASRSPS